MQILQVEPEMRPTLQQIKEHPFFRNKPLIPESLPETVFDRPLNQKELFEINEKYIKMTKPLFQ